MLAGTFLELVGFSKQEKVLAIFFRWQYNNFYGLGVTQLGERLTGSQERSSSIPSVSTQDFQEPEVHFWFFFIRAISRSNCLCDFSKKFLHGSIYSRILKNAPLGGVAQWRQRLTGSQEVRGSILSSTQECSEPEVLFRLFFIGIDLCSTLYFCGGFD